MEDFEKLSAFYLGKTYDLDKKQRRESLLLYDSKDLVTHAVCVGMTGSGKTGLCIDLIEEAAIDRIPAIVIDPKGDLGNLLLTFPELRPQDFQPWISPEEAGRKNLTVEELAAQQAQLWRNGLAEWGQDGSRIQRLREAADFRIYTPGSNAGFSVSILNSFSAPPPALREDEELLNERVATTVTSLLGLAGVDADPIRSREHILISNLIKEKWSVGTNLELASLITEIQSPPFSRIGVMELEAFYPGRERFELAMRLNSLLAAPSFSGWLNGEQLEVQNILYTADNKPRIAIFSIAHLSDPERMFFVSLLLNQILGWMRTQSGTTSLRAILYIDEIFGYLPPVANPPSKLPLLTLLKQARAFGLGIVLVTQNPVDLDYKALANTGTWFIGRLQTERDKARLLEGLEGISVSGGQTFDRQRMEQTLAGLGKRIFLLNNVHDDGQEIFESRWAMSYLCGPLTRTQIKTLTDPVKRESPTASGPPTIPTQPTLAQGTPAPAVVTDAESSRPVLPPEIQQLFLPLRPKPTAATFVYEPRIFAAAEVTFRKKDLDASESISLLANFPEEGLHVDWDGSYQILLPVSDFLTNPEGNTFKDLPRGAGLAKNFANWSKDFAGWIYRNHSLNLLHSPVLKITAGPGESERDFRIRLQLVAREKRDEAVARLREKYAPKLATLEERRRRAEQKISQESEQASSHKVQTAISFGATILSSFLGRKTLGIGTLGRATTAARGVGRSMKEAQDVTRAEESFQVVDQKMTELNEEFKEETAALEQLYDLPGQELETISLKPTKSNIQVKTLALMWAPYWQDPAGQKAPAWE